MSKLRIEAFITEKVEVIDARELVEGDESQVT